MNVSKVAAVWAAAAALAAALLVGCSSTDEQPSAPVGTPTDVPTSVAPLPDTAAKDQVFANALAQRSLTVPMPTTVAAQVCAGFNRSDPAPEILANVQQLTALDPDNAGYVLGAAVAAYCPEHLGQLRDAVG